MSKRKVIDSHFDHARKKQFNAVSIKKQFSAIGYQLDFDDESNVWSVSSLTRNELSVESLKELLNLLKEVRIVTKLDLRYNNIGAKAAIALVKGLADTNITFLDLSYNNMGNEGAIALVKGLAGTNVTTMGLIENDIGYKGVEAFAQYLKDTNITFLNLSENHIGSRGAIALAKYLKVTKITTLVLMDSNIGDKGAIAFAECLKDTNITNLSLSHNKIGGDGVTALAECLKDTNITNLWLFHNKIGEERIDFGAKIDSHKTSLAQITTELIEKNSPTPMKQLEFYVTIDQASLQEYLQDLGLKYNPTMLSARAKDILHQGYDFLLEQLSSFIYKEPTKITIEYCGKDFLLSLITTDSGVPNGFVPETLSTSTESTDYQIAFREPLEEQPIITDNYWLLPGTTSTTSTTGSSTTTISSSETTSGISMFNISFENLSNFIMNPTIIETSSTTEITLVGEEPSSE